jgi:trans-2,3-dihydro-3-hydroxyanthranilate isomerase
MPYDFVIADIFTDQAFGGNQLAVITDARGLSGEQMQRLAREFNFSESTFVLPPSREGADFSLRIFTPHAELKFAGHPTVGTAAVLASQGILKLAGESGKVVFEEGVGLVSVEVRAKAGAFWSRLTLDADVEMPGGEPGRDIVAAILSVPGDAVLGRWYCGIASPFCFVRLVSEDMVDRAVLDRAAWSAHLENAWAPQIFFFAGDPDEGRLYARMFAPGFGIDEDAATGSASAILAGCVAMLRPEADGEVSLSITQGVRMGRPSRLEASAVKAGGRVRSVSVGGGSVVVATGRLTVPSLG